MFSTAVLTFVVAILVSAFMAWTIGAGSTGATPFAPAVGANAISTMRAAFVVGILGFAGAALQGGNVAEAVGSELIRGVSLTAPSVIIALFVAGGLMAVGIRTGYPIATAFTVTGAIIGAGLAIGGAPAWGKYGEIGALWVFGPLVTAGIAFVLASILPRDDVPDDYSIPLLAGGVSGIIVNIEFAIPGYGMSSPVALVTSALPYATPSMRWALTGTIITGIALLLHRQMLTCTTCGMDRFLVVMGGVVAFSAGASQVGLAVGPLLPLKGSFPVSTAMIIVGGGIGLLVGSWTGAPRMIKAVSQDYAQLGPRRSISALVPAFLLAQIAVMFGIPISFNQIIISAILGSGFAVGGASGTSRGKLIMTVGAWIGSFIVAFGVGYGAMVAISGPV